MIGDCRSKLAPPPSVFLKALGGVERLRVYNFREKEGEDQKQSERERRGERERKREKEREREKRKESEEKTDGNSKVQSAIVGPRLPPPLSVVKALVGVRGFGPIISERIAKDAEKERKRKRGREEKRRGRERRERETQKDSEDDIDGGLQRSIGHCRFKAALPPPVFLKALGGGRGPWTDYF